MKRSPPGAPIKKKRRGLFNRPRSFLLPEFDEVMSDLEI
jgi:hypothetical protein